MFRAIPCSSSGGQIVLLQHLVSSLSVSSYSVHRLRADCSRVLFPRSHWNLSFPCSLRPQHGPGCLGLTTLPSSCADCLEIWEPQPPGNLTACKGNVSPFIFLLHMIIHIIILALINFLFFVLNFMLTDDFFLSAPHEKLSKPALNTHMSGKKE